CKIAPREVGFEQIRPVQVCAGEIAGLEVHGLQGERFDWVRRAVFVERPRRLDEQRSEIDSCAWHFYASDSSARFTTACVSGTLYPFLASGRAPSTAARPAAAALASLSGLPTIAASAFAARYGIGATPPSTMRASETRPSCIVTIAATLHNAKSQISRTISLT